MKLVDWVLMLIHSHQHHQSLQIYSITRSSKKRCACTSKSDENHPLSSQTHKPQQPSSNPTTASNLTALPIRTQVTPSFS